MVICCSVLQGHLQAGLQSRSLEDEGGRGKKQTLGEMPISNLDLVGKNTFLKLFLTDKSA